MMHALLTCGLRLAEALRAENEALAAMDLTRAADISASKTAASEAFAAAWASAQKMGMKTSLAAPGAVASPEATASALADRLAHLSAENRRLLEHAIALQARVIETIAGAALPRANPLTYGQSGGRPVLRATPAVALSSRA